ncbi:MAG TPA: hypothetical protein VHX38_09540 [Pseudonocardiaceae bacterium]|jgi:cell division septation protein DedD|nr:hypothetical protein [Pseudonocardiaceae bacterium]
MDESIELLATVVVAAEDEAGAREACGELCWHVEGQVIESTDCSAEEPGCWSVTISVPTDERATHNMGAPLARAVRRFVRSLGPALTLPRVSCEPPTAWTVLDDPEALGGLVPGAERLLIEAWCGPDPYRMRLPAQPQQPAKPQQQSTPQSSTSQSSTSQQPKPPKPKPPARPRPPVKPEPEPQPEPELRAKVDEAPKPATEPEQQQQVSPAHRWIPPEDKQNSTEGYRLSLRVDVATVRAAGAEWQARAVASRISGTATLTGVTEHDGVLSVHVDLGPAIASPPQTVLTAVSALDRAGWSPLRWEGDTAITSWTADPPPSSGITALELSSGPAANGRRPHQHPARPTNG